MLKMKLEKKFKTKKTAPIKKNSSNELFFFYINLKFYTLITTGKTIGRLLV